MSSLDEQLLKAVKGGELVDVKRLVQEGANVNCKDVYGMTPLIWASCHGHTEVMRFFIEKGANVHANSNTGWTPLHYAINRSHLGSTFLSLDNGADLSVTNNEGKTPLDKAKNNDVFLTKLIHSTHRQLKTGITNVQDKMDSTAAARSGQHSNTGSAELESQMAALQNEMATLSEELKTNTVALQNQTMSEVSALFEQHKIASTNDIDDKLKPEHSLTDTELARAEQAKDDRIFNLMMKRKQLLDAGFPACEIDEQLQLPLPGKDEYEPPAKKLRFEMCKTEKFDWSNFVTIQGDHPLYL
jgi:hypothetical protein